MNKPQFLLDVNTLIALTDEAHPHHRAAARWFATPGLEWGLCALTDTGLLRLSMHPRVGNLILDEASGIVSDLSRHPGYHYWPIAASWAELTAPFRERVFGHQQIADAYLLGLAIRANAVLVTLDKAILAMAGPQYREHVLVLAY